MAPESERAKADSSTVSAPCDAMTQRRTEARRLGIIGNSERNKPMKKPAEIRKMMEAAATAARTKGWAVTVVEDTVAQTLAWVLGEHGASLPYGVEDAAKEAAKNSPKKRGTKTA